MPYKRNILHVDDDAQTTLLVGERLQQLGYEVTGLNDPTRTLQEIEKVHPRLVLLDIHMPPVDGLELLRSIKAYDNKIQVIMLSSQTTLLNVVQAFECGAEYFVFKPVVPMKRLIDAIDQTFRKIEHWWSAIDELTQQPTARAKSANV